MKRPDRWRPDDGGYPEWSRENVDWLAEEWRQARPVLDGVLALLAWQSESPAATASKLAAVRDALLAAHESGQTHGPATSHTPATAA